MKKKKFYFSAMTIVIVALLSICFVSCGGDDSGSSSGGSSSGDKDPTPAASIKVNGSSSTDLTFSGNFDGKSGIDYKQSVAVVSTTQWSISKDADWISVSPSNGNGSVEMVIYPTSENPSASPRTATITLSGSEVSATIRVTQDGGKPFCYVEPQNIVALWDRMAWEYSASGNVNKFQYILLSETEYNRMTDKEMIKELNKREEMKYADDYLTTVGKDYSGKAITANTAYYIVTMAYNTEDKVGELKKTKITTPAYLNADKDAWVSFDNLGYYSNWAGFSFETKKEGYCNTYHIIYGLYTEQVNSVVHAFEINYYLKNKKKHWLAAGFGWEIITDYPNNHAFNYYSTSLPSNLQPYVSNIPWAFASAWGVFKDGTLSSDLLGFQINLGNYNSSQFRVQRKQNGIMENRTFKRSEIIKKL